MLLKKLIIKNFMGISEKQEMDFSVSNKAKESLKNNLMFKKEGESLIPLVIGFIGKNASGKTSILDSITLLINWMFYEDFLFEKYFNKNQEKFNQKEKNKDIMSSNKENKLNNTKLSFKSQKKIFSNEYHDFLKSSFIRYSNDQKNPIEIEIFFADKDNNYKLKVDLTPKKMNKWIWKNGKKVANLPISFFWNLDFNKNDVHLKINDVLKQQQKLIEIIGVRLYNDILKMIDNNVKKINFIKNDENNEIKSNIYMNNGAKIKFSLLSKGTIKILSFLAKIFIQENKKNQNYTICFIDEIENHLHIKLVNFLLKVFSMCLTNTQLIFTTHSLAIMENIDRHAIWAIQNEDRTKIKKVSSIIREGNSFYKKFISEEISSHPSSSEINEVLYKLKENKKSHESK